MKRVGYWMSEKKIKKLNFEEHVDLFRNAGVELLKIDLERPLEDQGPFDVILHKFTDIMVQAQQGYKDAKKYLQNIQKYIDHHPDCIIVDPLDGIRKLLDRYEQYQLVLQCDLDDTGSYMFMPSFVELTSKDIEDNKRKLDEAKVHFPIVCKPTLAHGTRLCHQMALVFNEEGLKDISPPCVAQTFVNHNATLYKIFKIGSKMYVGHRPSIKNMTAGDHKTIFFDTHDVCKSDSSSNYLTELDYADLESSPTKPDLTKFQDLGEALRRVLKLDLFGVDVIIECDTQRYAVIDINVFPGYDEVDNFFSDLLDHLLFLMNQRQEEKICCNRVQNAKTLLKDLERKPSEESLSEHISTKRLKTTDHSIEGICECQCSKLENGKKRECTRTEHVNRWKPEFLRSEDQRRNQINAAGTIHNFTLNGCQPDIS